MELKDGWWIGKDNNRWDSSRYPKSLAEELEKTLVNCYNCFNCFDCSECSDCSHCSHCSECSHCSYCSECSYCFNCSECSHCSDCSHCSHCSHCSDCSECSDCSYCFDCSDCSHCSDCSDCLKFEDNPQRFLSSRIGSREAQTIIYWTGQENLLIICGCYKARSIKEFKDRVESTYDENSPYRKEYLDLIKIFEYIVK